MEKLEFAGWAVGQRLRLLGRELETSADGAGGAEVEEEGEDLRH